MENTTIRRSRRDSSLLSEEDKNKNKKCYKCAFSGCNSSGSPYYKTEKFLREESVKGFTKIMNFYCRTHRADKEILQRYISQHNYMKNKKIKNQLEKNEFELSNESFTYIADISFEKDSTTTPVITIPDTIIDSIAFPRISYHYMMVCVTNGIMIGGMVMGIFHTLVKFGITYSNEDRILQGELEQSKEYSSGTWIPGILQCDRVIECPSREDSINLENATKKLLQPYWVKTNDKQPHITATEWALVPYNIACAHMDNYATVKGFSFVESSEISFINNKCIKRHNRRNNI